MRDELNALGEDAGPVRDHVNSLIDDLERQLQDLDHAAYRATMRDRLAGLIEQFESEHPAITGMLERILTTLASMGV